MRCVFLVRSEKGKGKGHRPFSPLLRKINGLCQIQNKLHIHLRHEACHLVSTQSITLRCTNQQHATALHLEKNTLAPAFSSNSESLLSLSLQIVCNVQPLSHRRFASNKLGQQPDCPTSFYLFAISNRLGKKYNHFILILTVSVLTVQPNVGWYYFFSLKEGFKYLHEYQVAHFLV